MRLPKIILLLAFLTATFSPFVTADCKKTKPPTKNDIEKLFGKPIDKAEEAERKCFAPATNPKELKEIACPCATDAYICYKQSGGEVRVKFDSSGNAETIELFRGDAKRNAIRLLFGELTGETWDKFHNFFNQGKPNEIDLNDFLGCDYKEIYENECFTIKYVVKGSFCVSLPIEHITIDWKK